MLKHTYIYIHTTLPKGIRTTRAGFQNPEFYKFLLNCYPRDVKMLLAVENAMGTTYSWPRASYSDSPPALTTHRHRLEPLFTPSQGFKHHKLLRVRHFIPNHSAQILQILAGLQTVEPHLVSYHSQKLVESANPRIVLRKSVQHIDRMGSMLGTRCMKQDDGKVMSVNLRVCGDTGTCSMSL